MCSNTIVKIKRIRKSTETPFLILLFRRNGLTLPIIELKNSIWYATNNNKTFKDLQCFSRLIYQYPLLTILLHFTVLRARTCVSLFHSNLLILKSLLSKSKQHICGPSLPVIRSTHSIIISQVFVNLNMTILYGNSSTEFAFKC